MEPITAAASVATIDAAQRDGIMKSLGPISGSFNVKELGARVDCNSRPNAR